MGDVLEEERYDTSRASGSLTATRQGQFIAQYKDEASLINQFIVSTRHTRIIN
jgi:hypothetical protein